MQKSELLDRVKFVTYGGKRILRFNFAGLGIADALEAIAYAKGLVAKLPERSLLTLTNVTDANFDKLVTEALKDLARHNAPYVIAGAAVGVVGLKKVVFQAIMAVSGRKNLKAFDDEEQAMAWLISYRG